MIAAADKAVPQIGKEKPCGRHIKIAGGHTTILVDTNGGETQSTNVTLVTTIEESSTSFSFAPVQNERDHRRAQRRLPDFSTYLEQ